MHILKNTTRKIVVDKYSSSKVERFKCSKVKENEKKYVVDRICI